MQHLSKAWPKVRDSFGKKRMMLFLDYDGTLAPIAAQPEDACLSILQKQCLTELAEQKHFPVAIVSGRRLKDLKSKVKVPGFIYVGNHGLEVEGPQIRHVHPEAPDLRKKVKRIAGELEAALKDMPGIRIENKVLTLSVHYRNAEPRVVPKAMAGFLRVLDPYIHKSHVSYAEGKKVWEVRPGILWDKGKAVHWLLAQAKLHEGGPVTGVYIGDDHTDEAAFRTLKRNGFAIRVTDDPDQSTSAEYFLLSCHEVYQFLRKLIRLSRL